MSRQDELMKPAYGMEPTLPLFILDNLPALVYVKAADYSVPYANRFFRDHFGDPENRACYHLIYGRTEPCKVCATFRVWGTGKPAKYEWPAPNGRTYEMHSHPYEGPNGERLVLHLGVDITDRKRAEGELSESEERFRSIFEYSLDGILLSAPDGRVFNANPAACRIFGRTEKEICEVGMDGLIDRRDAQWSTVVEQMSRTDGMRGELSFDRKNGTVFPAEISMTVFRTSEGEDRISSIIRDISQRKQAEAALREKTDALERSNKDLEEFAYVTAHDLREPLVGIGAYLKLLERRSGHSLDDESRKFVTRAVETVARMDSLIRSLLAYSRVAENSEELETIDANSCLRQALANLKSVINETATSVTSDSLPTLKARPAQLVQVFQNLIGNGIKFRGTEPPKIHVAFTPSEDDYHFSVCDNGRGIELPYLDKIFQIFQRVDDSSGPSGTGIGLATCKKIVERHGGRIWVGSEPGKGSTFHFTFPKS